MRFNSILKTSLTDSVVLLLLSLLLIGCKGNKVEYDASGTFEAIETLVSAEANGIIKVLDVEEGQVLQAGQKVGAIDSTQIKFKKEQIIAQMNSIRSRKPAISTQIAALQSQLEHAEHERNRTANLVKADAATPKQLDDANAQVSVLKRQIEAQRSSLSINSVSLDKDIEAMEAQLKEIDNQLSKCLILNPIQGTVLLKYAEANEMTTVGKPIYKIADLTSMILRAYITGDQFSSVQLNQKVRVFVDDSANGFKEYPGTVEWISSKAEFTPKTIQTKKERENLVYAIKIKVDNQGLLKIGMYGQVNFN